MILLAFFVPLGLYFLVLGVIHKRSTPFVVAGTWDAITLLAGCSGFLLAGGPAVLLSIHDRWRRVWMYGQGSQSAFESLSESWMLWTSIFLSYLLLVLVGGLWLIYRRRGWTCIYHTSVEMVQQALIEGCARAGLQPHRLGPNAQVSTEAWNRLEFPVMAQSSQRGEVGGAVEVDAFPTFFHVILRWKPADCPQRRVVEPIVRRLLKRAGSPENDLASWLSLTGGILLLGSGAGGVMLVVRAWLRW